MNTRYAGFLAVVALLFFAVGMFVVAVRRWRESESELVARRQAQADLQFSRDELELRVDQRTRNCTA